MTVDQAANKLTWAAVDGATSYTVKINDSDESLNNITATELDLASDAVKLLLKSGENSFAVKANETETHLASGYAAAATKYQFVVTVDEEIAAYHTLVEAIGSITAESTDAQAQAVLTAITSAETKYAGLSAEAQASAGVTADKATFDAKKTAFEGIYNPARAAYETFQTALTAATAEATSKASLSALNTKKAAADTAKNALNALAASMLTAEESTAYASLATTAAAWTEAVDAAKAKWTGLSFEASSSLAAAEANIVKAEGLNTEYAAYEAYVKAEITAEQVKLVTDALAAAKGYIENAAASLKTTVSAFEGKPATITQAYHETLQGYQTEIAALKAGAYSGKRPPRSRRRLQMKSPRCSQRPRRPSRTYCRPLTEREFGST